MKATLRRARAGLIISLVFSGTALCGVPRNAEMQPGNAGPLLLVHQKFAANSWIDREHNKRGERCCDAGKDCHTVPADRVMSHRDGVMLPDYDNVEIPGNQIQVSQDGQYWVCIWGGKVRCFHAPHNGS